MRNLAKNPAAEYFVNKEFTYAAERTTARLTTGFENDEPVYHAFTVIKWDGTPGVNATQGELESWDALEPTPANLDILRAKFKEHVTARL